MKVTIEPWDEVALFRVDQAKVSYTLFSFTLHTKGIDTTLLIGDDTVGMYPGIMGAFVGISYKRNIPPKIDGFHLLSSNDYLSLDSGIAVFSRAVNHALKSMMPTFSDDVLVHVNKTEDWIAVDVSFLRCEIDGKVYVLSGTLFDSNVFPSGLSDPQAKILDSSPNIKRIGNFAVDERAKPHLVLDIFSYDPVNIVFTQMWKEALEVTFIDSSGRLEMRAKKKPRFSTRVYTRNIASVRKIYTVHGKIKKVNTIIAKELIEDIKEL
jgi:hypothetical protein